MNSSELKQKIINKLNSVDDIYLLNRVMDTLQPFNQNETRPLKGNELDMIREMDEDLKYGKSISRKQINKRDSNWFYEL